MEILAQLSSQTGDRTEASNHAVAARCLAAPDLLVDIAGGLTSDDAALIGDCAEVLTFVSETRPDLVVPYAGGLIDLLEHPTTRVRWEVVHALSHIGTLAPAAVLPGLPIVLRLLEADRSVIVRDHAVDVLVAVACGDPSQAESLTGYLLDALDRWDGKQAARILSGLASIARVAPDQRAVLGGVGMQWSDHPRPGARKAAMILVKAADASR